MTLPESPKGCPMDTILRLLMGPWTTYILYVLRTRGPTRFGALKRQVGGISSKMLTERLRLLEAAEVVRREYVPTIPPQVTYSLAPRGRELAGVIDQLNKIAQRWTAEEAVQTAGAEPRGRTKRAAA